MIYKNEDDLIADLKALRVGQSVTIETDPFVTRGYIRGYIKKKARNDFVLVDSTNKVRTRWGTAKEIAQDGMFFTWNGHLPPPSGERW